MANMCTNELTLRGNLEDIKRFDEQFKKEHKRYSGGTAFTGGRPQLLQDLKEEYESVNPLKIDEGKVVEYIYIEKTTTREGYSLSNFVEMTRDDFLTDWHSWATNNWGTKWDINDVQTDEAEDFGDGLWVKWYDFQTAWNPALEVVIEMAKQFPEIEFELNYYELGDDINGEETFFNGERFELE